MNNTYVDRGIIKWAPFDGLAGFNDLYKQLKYRLGKKDRPLLSEDQLYEMDINLQKALHEHLDVYLSYYQDGYIKASFGKVTKIDAINKIIYIDGLKYPLSMIVDLSLDSISF
ncbi:MAG: YolD-like family protein [Acholeplasmataceae bacterium]